MSCLVLSPRQFALEPVSTRINIAPNRKTGPFRSLGVSTTSYPWCILANFNDFFWGTSPGGGGGGSLALNICLCSLVECSVLSLALKSPYGERSIKGPPSTDRHFEPWNNFLIWNYSQSWNLSNQIATTSNANFHNENKRSHYLSQPSKH